MTNWKYFLEFWREPVVLMSHNEYTGARQSPTHYHHQRNSTCLDSNIASNIASHRSTLYRNLGSSYLRQLNNERHDDVRPKERIPFRYDLPP